MYLQIPWIERDKKRPRSGRSQSFHPDSGEIEIIQPAPESTDAYYL